MSSVVNKKSTVGWKVPDHQNPFLASLKTWILADACSGAVDRVHRDHTGEWVCVYKYTVLVHVSGQSGGPRLANPNNTKGSIFVSFHRSTRTEMEPVQDYLRSVPCFGWVPSAAFGVKSSLWAYCVASQVQYVPVVPPCWGGISSCRCRKTGSSSFRSCSSLLKPLLLCFNRFQGQNK